MLASYFVKLLSVIRRLFVAICGGLLVSAVVALMVNQNFFGYVQSVDKIAEGFSLIKVGLILLFLALALVAIYPATLSILKSFFSGSSKTDVLFSYVRFATILVLLWLNPWGVIAYSEYTKLLTLALAVIPAIAALGILLDLTKRDSKEDRQSEVAFISDKSATDLSGKDLSDSQRAYLAHLTHLLRDGSPQTVSLTGPWGSGKTLIYKMARNNVHKESDNIVWVEFESWRYASEEALVKGFYESIAKALELKAPTYQNIVKVMTRAVNQFVSKSDSAGLAGLLGQVARGGASDMNRPDEVIYQTLDRENLRLVIVVDDIERHYTKERIFRTLQLVHHAKSIHESKIQVLSIFEKEAVLNATPAHVQSPSLYLEKFSEMDISILPPGATETRRQVDKYLSKYGEALKIGDEFTLPTYENYLSSLGSYRLVIKIFNELILVVRTGKDRKYSYYEYVCFNDRFAMAHIKLSYPVFYKDIYEDQGFYTGSLDPISNLRLFWMDDEEKKASYEKHFDDLVQKSNLGKKEEAEISRIICTLFPHVAGQLGQSSDRSNVSSADLKNAKQVASAEVLDAYFETTERLEDSNASDELVKLTLGSIEDLSNWDDDSLLRHMKQFMSSARERGIESTSFFSMQQSILRSQENLGEYKLPILRAWLRATLNIQASTDEESRRVLGRILTVSDELIRKASLSDTEKEKRLAKQLFVSVRSFIADPRAATLLLLYLVPDRGNNYFPNYVAEELNKNNGLFVRVLAEVERLIVNDNINVYEEYDYGDWAFVTYQWAYSIRASGGGGVNSSVAGSGPRYVRAIEHLTSLLQDDEVAYRVISRRREDRSVTNAFADEKNQINARTFEPFKASSILAITDKLRNSKKLETEQRSEMRDIYKHLQSIE